MLKLAGKYADICYIPQFRNESYEEEKEKVLRAADRENRSDKIAFMAGSLSSEASYRSKEYLRKVEATKEKGVSYFLTSFPRNEEIIASIGRFAKEVIPSFK